MKSCWPSNLERQNVGLVLRVFNESTAAALQLHASRENLSSHTSEFISLITNIWKIFNVNILTGSRGFIFVLSSFLQNDPLEHHFSLYRMMSGAQYNVMLSQILETERRNKLSGILKLFSATFPANRPDSLKEFLKHFLIRNAKTIQQLMI